MAICGMGSVRRRHATCIAWLRRTTMATRRTKTTTTKKAPSARAGSWMALLAATTLGVDAANTVRAEVRADADLADSREYRLVVQSYDGSHGRAPSFRTRPV